MYTPPPEDALWEHPHALLLVHAVYLGVLSAPYPAYYLVPLIVLFVMKHAKDVYPLSSYTENYVNGNIVYLIVTGLVTYHFFRVHNRIVASDKPRLLISYILWHLANAQYRERFCHDKAQRQWEALQEGGRGYLFVCVLAQAFVAWNVGMMGPPRMEGKEEKGRQDEREDVVKKGE